MLSLFLFLLFSRKELLHLFDECLDEARGLPEVMVYNLHDLFDVLRDPLDFPEDLIHPPEDEEKGEGQEYEPDREGDIEKVIRCRDGESEEFHREIDKFTRSVPPFVLKCKLKN